MIQQVGGRQYIVFPGRYLYTQRLKDANVDDQVYEHILSMLTVSFAVSNFFISLVQIVLNKVLLVGTKTHTYIGKPIVTNATVHAVVENQVKSIPKSFLSLSGVFSTANLQCLCVAAGSE